MKENEKYIKWGLTAAAVVVVGLLCFFLLFRFDRIAAALGTVNRILAPFLYGAVIAYLLAPLCGRLERFFKLRFKGKRDGLASGLSILLSLVLALAIVVAVALLVVPQLVDSISGLAENLPGQLDAANEKLNALLEHKPEWREWWETFSGNASTQIETWIKTKLPITAQSFLTGAASKIADLAATLKNLLLGLITAVYFLGRRRQQAAQAKLILFGAFKPAWADWIENETHFADRMFNGFFMGKLLDSAIVGAICFVGCLVMGFVSPLLIAVIVGVTNIIPFFGPFIGAIPSALLLLLDNPTHCLMFLIFIVILQQLDGNVIGPRILGNTTGLAGLWVMFAILLFGGLWGIGGMIVCVPLIAVIYDVIRHLTHIPFASFQESLAKAALTCIRWHTIPLEVREL